MFNRISSLSFTLLFVLALALPMKAWGGAGDRIYELYQTEIGTVTMYNYFDQRERQTYIQVTNICNEVVVVHVQIWNVANKCFETDFFDEFTRNDTHVYDFNDIQMNSSAFQIPLTGEFEDGYGAVVVQHVKGVNGEEFPTNGKNAKNCLIGNMRILDDVGYEYRTNSAGEARGSGNRERRREYSFNFNMEGDTVLSDVIIIPIGEENDDGRAELENIEDAFIVIKPIIYNENEIPLSCPRTLFACLDHDAPLPPSLLNLIVQEGADGNELAFEQWGFNLGINNKYENSRGAPSICGGQIPTGHVRIRLASENGGDSDAEVIVGFIGINNGVDRGTFDSMWQLTNDHCEDGDEKTCPAGDLPDLIQKQLDNEQ